MFSLFLWRCNNNNNNNNNNVIVKPMWWLLHFMMLVLPIIWNFWLVQTYLLVQFRFVSSANYMSKCKKYKEAYLIGVAIPNSHDLHNSITKKLQKYTYFKVELIRIWQLRMSCKIPLVLSTTGVIANKLHNRLKLINLYLALYCTFYIVMKFLVELWMKSAWSVRSILIWTS